jgi:hypothetical protein
MGDGQYSNSAYRTLVFFFIRGLGLSYKTICDLKRPQRGQIIVENMNKKSFGDLFRGRTITILYDL